MTEPQYDHNDIMRQLAAGEKRFTAIDERLTVLLDRVSPIPAMQLDIASAKTDITETRELVEAWAAVKTFGRFFKWASGVLAGVLAVTAIVRAAARGLL